MHVFNLILNLCQFVLALLVIVIIAIQQTKNEGLGGTIGGTVQSSFKGKPGYEERLTDLTRMIGIGFFTVSILAAITAGR